MITHASRYITRSQPFARSAQPTSLDRGPVQRAYPFSRHQYGYAYNSLAPTPVMPNAPNAAATASLFSCSTCSTRSEKPSRMSSIRTGKPAPGSMPTQMTVISVTAATRNVVIRSMRLYPPLASRATPASAVSTAHGCSGRLTIAADTDGQLDDSVSANHFDGPGKTRFNACPTPPAIPPTWNIVADIMISHHHASQCAPRRGPGSETNAVSVGLPD